MVKLQKKYDQGKYMARYFDNILGNAKLKSMLCSYIENTTLPHAFIIEGPVGSGRKHIAKSIAAAISCKNKDGDIIPCTKCINCEKIFINVCPDVITVDTDGKQTIGVELIRELSAHTYMTPNELDLKVYIIDGADKMTIPAQNAFLKTLEEPVTEVMYFLVCENSQMLLPTIISRAPIIRTAPISADDIYVDLGERFPALENDKLRLVSILCRGNLGDGLSLISDEEKMQDLLSRRNEIYSFFKAMKSKGKKSEFFDFFTSDTEKNSTAIDRLRLLYSAFRDIIAYKELKVAEFDFFIDTEDISGYTAQIKPKYAKKLCAHIENALAQLYLNQGSSSVYSIMFSLACDAWGAKI